jgi:hypothetical protein
MVRFRGVPLAGHILCEKHVAWLERSLRAVAQSNLDATGKRDAPLAARRVVPGMKIIPECIVLEHERCRGDVGQEMLRSLVLIQIFEMRLPVISGVKSAKLHAASGIEILLSQLPAIHPRFQAMQK